jgi:zinc D-Ala-D-Ala dipeptidase
MRYTKIIHIIPFLIFSFTTFIHSNLISQNSCSYPAVKTQKAYADSIAKQPKHQLIPVKTLIKNIVLDIRYATANNFLQKKLYPSSAAFLNIEAAKALKKVQDSLQQYGLGLKIYDAYRPYRYTCEMWELIKDERYVAHPASGSGHNKGLAVDLTIINLATKKEIAMPTGFDNFSDTAHHSFTDLSTEVLNNRALLKNVMEYFGFNALATEWWHYSFKMEVKPPVFDLNFNLILRPKKKK